MDMALERPASPRHTLVLCIILLAVAAAGFAQTLADNPAQAASLPGGAMVYLPLLAAEWGLFAYVVMGLKRGGASVRQIISARWTWRSLFTDILIGLGVLALWIGVEATWALAPWSGGASGGTLARQALQVRDAADIPLWILLSMSAGFVEELVFRGYLQKQFGALMKNMPAGLVLQAVLFGVSHGYQGWEPVIRITVFGLIFGSVAMMRKSLRPGMIAHAMVDIIGGLVH